MNTLIIRTNTVTRLNYDENGFDFDPRMPQVIYRSRLKIEWYLYSATPNANELGCDIAKWTPDTSFSGCSAYLSCDNDWIHKINGTLLTEISAGASISAIQVNVSGASNATIPTNGIIDLLNASGEFDQFAYTARSISGTTVTYSVSVTPAHSFSIGDTARVSQSLLFQSVLDAMASDTAKGKFCFDLSVYSEKLANLAESSTSQIINSIGLELLPFTIDSGNIISEMPSYLLDSMSLAITIADASVSPVITTAIENTIAAIVAQKMQLYAFNPQNTGTVSQVLTKTSTGYKWADGGGGGGGATDYDLLENRPQINSKTVEGSKNGSYYGLLDAPATAGTNGQVLTKTTTGVEWQDPGSLYWQE